MGTYICTDCGATANSKCAASRNVFIDDDMVTMIGNCFTYEASRKLPQNEHQAKYDTPEWTVTVKYRTFDHYDDKSAIRALIKTLTSYPPELMKKALCNHVFRLTSPTCEMGCCKQAIAENNSSVREENEV